MPNTRTEHTPGRATLETVLRFGKYRGLSVRAIARFNPQYLIWADRELRAFQLGNEARGHASTEARKAGRAKARRSEGWAWGFGSGAKRSAEAARKRAIEIEHEERRKAGQEVCPTCFPNAWPSCDCCRGRGWIPARDHNAMIHRDPA